MVLIYIFKVEGGQCHAEVQTQCCGLVSEDGGGEGSGKAVKTPGLNWVVTEPDTRGERASRPQALRPRCVGFVRDEWEGESDRS